VANEQEKIESAKIADDDTDLEASREERGKQQTLFFL
jgi:hypothetical protein